MTDAAQTPGGLREQVAAALADANLRAIGDGLSVRPFAAKSPMALAYADAALAVLDGLRRNSPALCLQFDEAVDVVRAADAESSRSVPGEWDTARWRAKQIVKALAEAGLLTVQEAGRCGDPAPRLTLNGAAVGSPVHCQLPAGHDGWHRGDDRSEWSTGGERAQPKRYWVGYYCPRGSGHYEIYGQPEYTPECGSKGWNVYLDAEEGDEYLPEGDWR